MRGLDLALDGTWPAGCAYTDFTSEVLLDVRGGTWHVRDSSVRCRHGVCVLAEGGSSLTVEGCGVGGVYDEALKKELYQYRVQEIEAALNLDEVNDELVQIELDVIRAGAAVVGVWGRGGANTTVRNCSIEYASVSPKLLIRDDRKGGGMPPEDYKRMADHVVRMSNHYMWWESNFTKREPEEMPPFPRMPKRDDIRVGSGVRLEGRARGWVVGCEFLKNDAAISVDDYTHTIIEDNKMLQGNYGFVDALEWAKSIPHLAPTDVGATVEISGNRVVGRLWCSSNIPKNTRVRRMNEVLPTQEKPSFMWDEKFKADRQEREEIISKAYDKKRRLETYYQRMGDPNEPESSGDDGLLDSEPTSYDPELPFKIDKPVPKDPNGPFGIAPCIPNDREFLEPAKEHDFGVSLHESSSEFVLPSEDEEGNPKEYPPEESSPGPDSVPPFPLDDNELDKPECDPEGFYTPLITPDTSCEPTSNW